MYPSQSSVKSLYLPHPIFYTVKKSKLQYSCLDNARVLVCWPHNIGRSKIYSPKLWLSKELTHFPSRHYPDKPYIATPGSLDRLNYFVLLARPATLFKRIRNDSCPVDTPEVRFLKLDRVVSKKKRTTAIPLEMSSFPIKHEISAAIARS